MPLLVQYLQTVRWRLHKCLVSKQEVSGSSRLNPSILCIQLLEPLKQRNYIAPDVPPKVIVKKEVEVDTDTKVMHSLVLVIGIVERIS